MQLEYFEYLCKINQCRSIAAAAKELYIGQATLRSILKRMEEELGFAIFLRGRDQLELTAEGEEAVELARELSAIYEKMRQLGQGRQVSNQTVQLLCSPSINCALASPLSAAMARAGVGNLTIAETSGTVVSTKILQNEFNIALTFFRSAVCEEYRATVSKYQIQVQEVYHDHLYLLMRYDNPLSQAKKIDISQLSGKEFALLAHFTLSNDHIASTKPIQGRNRITTFSNVPLIKRAVLEQNMLSILGGYAIHYDESVDNSLLRAVPLSSDVEENDMDLCLIHRELQSLQPAERYVVSFIKDYFSQLPPPPFSPEG